MRTEDARRLRGLPKEWERAVSESAIDGLLRRGRTLASQLSRQHRKRDAAELRRFLSLLERADELHRHASDVETLTGLYRALTAFTGEEDDPAVRQSFTWIQTGAVEGETFPAPHGPAFRETAAIRNRAFRLVAAAIARLSRPSL